MVERWRPIIGKAYRIGDRLLRLLYVRHGLPIFEIEVDPLPIECTENRPQEEDRKVGESKSA